MKVKCINNQNVEGNLKINVEYPVLKDKKEMYVIELKKGSTGTYLKTRFQEVEDWWK